MDINVLMIMLYVAIIVYLVWWSFKKRLALRYKYEFLALRSKMRDFAIKGKIESESPYFKALDSYLTSIIDDIGQINIYKSAIMGLVYKKSAVKTDRDKLIEDLRANKKLDLVFNEFMELVTKYSIKKHFIVLAILTILSLPIFGSVHLFNKIKLQMKNKIKDLFVDYEQGAIIANECC